jgi:hypothetical protein
MKFSIGEKKRARLTYTIDILVISSSSSSASFPNDRRP